jgi:hypothetical protein
MCGKRETMKGNKGSCRREKKENALEGEDMGVWEGVLRGSRYGMEGVE